MSGRAALLQNLDRAADALDTLAIQLDRRRLADLLRTANLSWADDAALARLLVGIEAALASTATALRTAAAADGFDVVVELAPAVRILVQAARALAGDLTNARQAVPARPPEEIAAALRDALLLEALTETAPILPGILVLLGLVGPAGGRDAMRIEWSALAGMLRDPMAALASPDTLRAALGTPLLRDVLVDVLRVLGLPGGAYEQSAETQAHLGNLRPRLPELRLPLLAAQGPEGSMASAGITVTPIEDPPGVVIVPFVTGTAMRDLVPTTPGFTALIEGDLSASGILAIQASGVELRPSPGAGAIASAAVTLGWESVSDETILVLGQADGSRLEIVRPAAGLSARLGTDIREAAVVMGVRTLRIVFAPDASDGLLATVIGGTPILLEQPVAIRIASNGGVSFDGAAGLSLTVPTTISLGPVRITAVDLTLGLGPDAIEISARADLSARLGPLDLAIQDLGLMATIGEGEEGPAIEIGPTPPTGIGLALDLGLLSGGGFLSVEPGRYAGALELAVGDLALAAFGLVETRLPDGSNGFSMLLFVSGQFAPVQLGFGFTLLGVGGLLGIHRDVDPDALFAAVRAGTAGDLLAPEDPVRDAARLIALAEGIFPSRRGQYVFGPTVKLGWGTPTMMSLDLALAATLPEPLRLVLIGRLQGTIPSPVAPILKINLDLAGLLDLSGRRLELEGVLSDSAIQTIPIEGGFALRSSWGAERTLVFSIGGLHPSFEPPPRFPDLPRMGTTLTKGSTLRLTLGGYFAITSNTFQIGAAVDLRVSAAGFTLLGGLGFDALVEFDPFRMVVDVRARVQVMRGRRSITKLTFRGKLSGPNPWHARGKVVVEIPILPDVTVGASATFGRETAVPSTPVDVMKLVKNAIASAEAWRSAGPPAGLVLAPGAEGRIDPRGALRLRQEAAPLGQPWEHFYGKPVLGTKHAAVDRISVAGTPLVLGDPTEAAFPPAAFRRLTEAQRLAAPAFDDQTAGVEVDPSALTAGGDTALKDDARDTVVHGPEAQKTLAKDAGPAGVALEAPPASPPIVRVRLEQWRAADAEGRPIGPPTSWSAASLGPHAPVLAAEAA